jgi:hypothetical protein
MLSLIENPAYFKPTTPLQERIAEAAAHRQIRALNMEAGLKPSKRAKKEARAAAKKLAKGTYNTSKESTPT